MARSDFAPLFWISAMIGRTLAAARSALALRAAAPASRAASRFGLLNLCGAERGVRVSEACAPPVRTEESDLLPRAHNATLKADVERLEAQLAPQQRPATRSKRPSSPPAGRGPTGRSPPSRRWRPGSRRWPRPDGLAGEGPRRFACACYHKPSRMRQFAPGQQSEIVRRQYCCGASTSIMTRALSRVAVPAEGVAGSRR
jgi:hypothetical protein